MVFMLTSREGNGQVFLVIYLALAFSFQVKIFAELRSEKFRGFYVFILSFAGAMEALAAYAYLTRADEPTNLLTVSAVVFALALTALAFVISRIPFGK
jgi:hypothetical protein